MGPPLSTHPNPPHLIRFCFSALLQGPQIVQKELTGPGPMEARPSQYHVDSLPPDFEDFVGFPRAVPFFFGPLLGGSLLRPFSSSPLRLLFARFASLRLWRRAPWEKGRARSPTERMHSAPIGSTLCVSALLVGASGRGVEVRVKMPGWVGPGWMGLGASSLLGPLC